MAASADRSVNRRRWPRWKLTAKRCASSRSCCSTNISALLARMGIASFACGRKTRSGFFAAVLVLRPVFACRGRAASIARRRVAHRRHRRRPRGASPAAGASICRRCFHRRFARPPPPVRRLVALLGQRDDRQVGCPAPTRCRRRAPPPAPSPAAPCRRRRRSGRAASSCVRLARRRASPRPAEPPRQHLVHRREVVVVSGRRPGRAPGARTL